MEDMRSPEFPKFTLPLFEDVKKAFKLSNGRVFLFPSSGTGAWEAAISNTLNRGDKVLMSRFGQFSLLWVDMAQRLGLDVTVFDEEWGTGVPVEKYAEALAADKSHQIKAVFATHNETATGVTSDIAGVRKALDDAKHPALLFVDGVSSVGCIDFRMDEWGVDCCVSGSQKGFMLPTGLGLLAVSNKALEAHKTSKMERCYFSFEDMIKNNDLGYFPYTPATQLLRGLRASLDLLQAEGLDNVFARHHRLAEGVRKAVAAWGLKLCAKEPKWHSDTVSRDPRAGGRRQRQRREDRLLPLQPLARRRPQQGRRQGVPHRSPRRARRDHDRRRAVRRRDGACAIAASTSSPARAAARRRSTSAPPPRRPPPAGRSRS